MQQQWPILSYEKGKETYDTLHMWTQIVGKIKLALMPWVNHSWHVTLAPTSTGLSTGLVPYKEYNFQVDFDFVHHRLEIKTTKGEEKSFSLLSLSVKDFYAEIFRALDELTIEVTIHPVPVEIPDPVPFEEDTLHHTYDIEQITAFHQALLKIVNVFTTFRSTFKGKCSPIHFFWGGFDLALSFFRSPCTKHPAGIPGMPDWVAQEAYNREVSSGGFWTGNASFPNPAFYCYLYPEPEGYKTADIQPAQAYYHTDLGEFILTYEEVQQAEDSQAMLLEFLTSTYRAGADLAKWERDLLED